MNEKKITIIHFVYTLYGGVANVAAGLINYQNSIGIKTILAYCNYDSAIESQLEYNCEKIKVEIPNFPGSSMIFGMKVLKTYEKYKKCHPDEFIIVHVHNIQTLGFFSNWKRIPIICTLHGFNCPQKSIRKYFSDYLYRSTISKLLKYRKQITAVSRAIVESEECKKIKGRENIKIIHNFSQVDLKDKIKHKTFNIGHVGDLSYEKGWDTLWSAYKLFSKEDMKSIVLYAAGKEAEYTALSLSEEVKKLGIQNSVYYEGYVANAKKDFISKLDILVLASRNEGLGLVQIEAMGYGIPVLGRNTGGICEVLKDGYNGFVINDEVDLYNRIKELYNDKELYDRLSSNALSTYTQNFTFDIVMKKYESVYNSLLENNVNYNN